MIELLAHTVPPPDTGGGGGGPSLPLLALGGLGVAAAFVLANRGLARAWIPWAVVAAGLATAGLAFVVGGGGGNDGRPDAQVAITQPGEGERVPADKPIEIRVDVKGGKLASSPEALDGGHLHLYVDGQLTQMPYGPEAAAVLTAGPHIIAVEYVDHDHLSYNPPIVTQVQVVAT